MSRIEEIFTPVRWEKFQSYLKNYDEVEKQFVIQGFRDGFHLHSSIDRNIVLKHENMPSAFHYPEMVWEIITKEVHLQRVGGPFDTPPLAKYICSPLGLVPKAGQPGKFRLIFNLSAGEQSVNGTTAQQFRTTSYQDLDAAVELVHSLGSEARLGKADLEAAFQQTPIHPAYWSLLVFKAINPHTKNYQYFFDKCLPFGSAESCQIYQGISNALAWAVTQQTKSLLVNYLDDFLFADKGTEWCGNQLCIFRETCWNVGFPIVDDKTEWSSEWKIFLGLLLHGKLQMLAIPAEKINKSLAFVEFFLSHRKATVAQFMSIAGHLNFLTRALNFGRPFIRRLYDAVGPWMMKKRRHLKIHEGIKQDMEMWKDFLCTKPYCKSFIEYLELPG